MLVEDDTDVAFLIEAGLRREGHRVTTFVDPRPALRFLAEHSDAPRPDVILTDLNMPHMDGIELLERAFDILGGPRPAAVLSGYATASAIKRAEERGIAIAHKPLPPAELHALVLQLGSGLPSSR